MIGRGDDDVPTLTTRPIEDCLTTRRPRLQALLLPCAPASGNTVAQKQNKTLIHNLTAEILADHLWRGAGERKKKGKKESQQTYKLNHTAMLREFVWLHNTGGKEGLSLQIASILSCEQRLILLFFHVVFPSSSPWAQRVLSEEPSRCVMVAASRHRPLWMEKLPAKETHGCLPSPCGTATSKRGLLHFRCGFHGRQPFSRSNGS